MNRFNSQPGDHKSSFYCGSACSKQFLQFMHQHADEPGQNRFDLSPLTVENATNENRVRQPHPNGKPSDNNTLHTEPRAARLLETMIFAAAR